MPLRLPRRSRQAAIGDGACAVLGVRGRHHRHRRIHHRRRVCRDQRVGTTGTTRIRGASGTARQRRAVDGVARHAAIAAASRANARAGNAGGPRRPRARTKRGTGRQQRSPSYETTQLEWRTASAVRGAATGALSASSDDAWCCARGFRHGESTAGGAASDRGAGIESIHVGQPGAGQAQLRDGERSSDGTSNDRPGSESTRRADERASSAERFRAQCGTGERPIWCSRRGEDTDQSVPRQ